MKILNTNKEASKRNHNQTKPKDIFWTKNETWGRKTNRDHKDDPHDVSLISRFRIVQKMPINVKDRQSNGSSRAKKRNNTVVDRNYFPHSEKMITKAYAQIINMIKLVVMREGKIIHQQ